MAFDHRWLISQMAAPTAISTTAVLAALDADSHSPSTPLHVTASHQIRRTPRSRPASPAATHTIIAK
jgi:hypothetical protein